LKPHTSSVSPTELWDTSYLKWRIKVEIQKGARRRDKRLGRREKVEEINEKREARRDK
jgi:hypothetical protein